MVCLVSRSGRELQRYNMLGGRQVVGCVFVSFLHLYLLFFCQSNLIRSDTGLKIIAPLSLKYSLCDVAGAFHIDLKKVESVMVI